MDGPYSIKFKVVDYGDEEYMIFTSNGDGNLRMDEMSDSEYYPQSSEGGYVFLYSGRTCRKKAL